jgi:aspartate/methionine/tyrosine aminotransferase
LLWDAACEELTDNKLANPYLKYSKAISVGTMSKSFGMPGLRVGWCFANQHVIQNCVDLRDYTTLYVSPIIEHICECVMRNADHFINHRMQDVVENRRTLATWIEQKSGLVEWSKPQGGVSSLVRFKPIKQVDEFCISLAKEQSVMVVPGSCFNIPDFVRVGFGESREKFQEGLRRLDIHLGQF